MNVQNVTYPLTHDPGEKYIDTFNIYNIPIKHFPRMDFAFFR